MTTNGNESAVAVAARASYERRRVWSRTDTARWLCDRGAAALAVLRRRPGAWPAHDARVGWWLKEFAPVIFDRAHARLAAAADDAAREGLTARAVLR